MPDESQVSDRSSATEPASQVEQEELLDLLCENQSQLACSFVLQNMIEKGGDWSNRVAQRIWQRCGPLAGHIFTKSERRTCRNALHEALWRYENGDEHRCHLGQGGTR
jgi:hypothetical protein